MRLPRDRPTFKERIRAGVQRDPVFRKGLLREGVEYMLNGDVRTANYN